MANQRPDFLYEHPPLIEVIVDFQWKLQTVLGLPNAALDPHLNMFQSDFGQAMKQLGFGFVEKLIPDEVPRELLPHKPVQRFRKNANEWPVVQTGPGILTVNIVPPYDGWKSFTPLVREAFGALWTTYPVADRYLSPTKIDLTYINGFTEENGLVEKSDFIQSKLGFAVNLPNPVLESIPNGARGVSATGELLFPLNDPAGSRGVIKYGSGSVGKKPAVVLELKMQALEGATPKKPGALLAWLDTAHDLISSWFDALTSQDVKKSFGKIIPLNA